MLYFESSLPNMLWQEVRNNDERKGNSTESYRHAELNPPLSNTEAPCGCACPLYQSCLEMKEYSHLKPDILHFKLDYFIF